MTWTVDEAPANRGWDIKQCRDKDGHWISGREPGDYRAWIKSDRTHMLLQFGSEYLTQEQATELVTKLVAGLNTPPYPAVTAKTESAP